MAQRLTIISILSGIVLLYSCHQKTGNEILLEHIDTTAIIGKLAQIQASFFDIRQIRMRQLVSEIAELTEVQCGYLGIAGRPSKQPHYDSLLAENCNARDLDSLTDNRNVIVRYFAFQALVQNKYTKLKDIFYRHYDDAASYRFFCTCMIDQIPINVTFYNAVKYKLETEERKKFENKYPSFYILKYPD